MSARTRLYALDRLAKNALCRLQQCQLQLEKTQR